MFNFCLVFMVSPKRLGESFIKPVSEQQDIKSLFVVTNPASGN